MTDLPNELWTIDQVAEYLRLSVTTLRRRKSMIPYVLLSGQRGGKRRMYEVSDIKNFIKTHEIISN